MPIRTDLAIESHAAHAGEGVKVSEKTKGNIKITCVEVETEQASKRLCKPIGRYVTLDVGNIAGGLAETDGAAQILADEIKAMMPQFETALVIGLGNLELTADALGPKTAAGMLATRHIKGDFAESIGLTGLKGVAVLSPGVLGQTGMEAVEIIKSVTSAIEPDIVIAIDALAAADEKRLGTTVQINDCGIAPGSGVGNSRKEISEQTLGVKVLALGVPTVAAVEGKDELMLTLREIDLLTKRAGELLSHALNFALQPNIDREIILSLV